MSNGNAAPDSGGTDPWYKRSKAWYLGLGHVEFVALYFGFAVAFVVVVAVLVHRPPFANAVEVATAKDAKEALGLLKDATVWMAGIQTATLAALGFLACQIDARPSGSADSDAT